jgi:tetratricopeptide (TPR) repeat protein
MATWIELSPTTARPSAIPYRKRGEAYKAKGDLGRAIADYNKAIEIDPRDAISYRNRGYAYYLKKECQCIKRLKPAFESGVRSVCKGLRHADSAFAPH